MMRMSCPSIQKKKDEKADVLRTRKRYVFPGYSDRHLSDYQLFGSEDKVGKYLEWKGRVLIEAHGTGYRRWMGSGNWGQVRRVLGEIDQARICA